MKLHHFKPKKEKKGLLYQVFVVVAAIQITLLVSFGSYVVTRTVLEDENEFKAPPTTAKVDIAPKEQKVRVERQQKKSSKLTKRISISNPNNVNTPDVKINLPATIASGGGISTISDKQINANLKIAVSTVNLFGLSAKAEKILICIDASPYLMTDERGGLDTYKVIREDIKKLVNQLPSTSLFNLMAFDVTSGTRMSFFQPNLVAATPFNKKLAGGWIDPINSSLKLIGVRGRQYDLKYDFLPQPPGQENANNIYRVYQAALEQGADAIWFLTTRWASPEAIRQPLSDAQTQNYQRQMEKYENDKERMLKAAKWTEEDQLKYELELRKLWADAVKKGRAWVKNTNKERAAKGIPLYVGTPQDAANEQKLQAKYTGKTPPSIKLKRPQMRYKSYGTRGIYTFYHKKLLKEIYYERNLKPPVVNMIVFKGKDEAINPNEMKGIKSFCTSNNGGRVRVLRGLQAVKD